MHRNRYTYQALKISWTTGVTNDKKQQRLILKSTLGEFFFTVPLSWKLRKWSPACRRLAEVLIFHAFWDRADLRRFMAEDWTPWLNGSNGTISGGLSAEPEDPHLRRWMRRMKNDRSAVSFSGGLDSCAIVPLLPPGAVLAYMKRNVNKPTMMRHGQQLLALEHIRKRYKVSAYIMESNYEQLAVKSIGRIGFPSEYACVVPCVILADHVGITSICTGTIGLFLKRGLQWHDFGETDYYHRWTSLFRKAGIDLFWPVGGVVDRGTALICKKAGIPGQSCVRNDRGSCGQCFKCFRKNALCMEGGRSVTVIPEDARRKLRGKPLTLIELYQKGFINDKRLKKWRNFDLSYQKHHLLEACDYMIPDRLRGHIVQRLNHFLKPMNAEQIALVKSLQMEQVAKELSDVI